MNTSIYLAILALFAVSVVVAHERRIVADKYLFIVGFQAEPAYTNYLNGASLQVSINDTGLAVSGLDSTINCAVTVPGDATAALTVPLDTVYGTPGRYYAWFVPSKAGAYTFHFTGSIYDTSMFTFSRPLLLSFP